MANDIVQWRAAVGNFYNRTQGLPKTCVFQMTPTTYVVHKVKQATQYLINLIYSIVIKSCNIAILIQSCISCLILLNIVVSYLSRSETTMQPNANSGSSYFYNSNILLNIDYYLFLIKLSLLSGDIETNPGPNGNDDSCLSIMHQNIRSIRHKLDFVKENYMDFDILCFTESHLTETIESTTLSLEGFNTLFRKDNSAHSGGLLIYVTCSIVSRRITDLETILPESMWVKITDKNREILLCNVYRQP